MALSIARVLPQMKTHDITRRENQGCASHPKSKKQLMYGMVAGTHNRRLGQTVRNEHDVRVKTRQVSSQVGQLTDCVRGEVCVDHVTLPRAYVFL